MAIQLNVRLQWLFMYFLSFMTAQRQEGKKPHCALFQTVSVNKILYTSVQYA